MPITSLLLDRRSFLAGAAAMTASAAQAAAPFFKAKGLPIGIQLYTLGAEFAQDLDAGLAAVAKIGYRTVELPGLYGKSPAQLRASLDNAGLACPACHIPAQGRGTEIGLDGDMAKLADGLATLGVKTAVVPMPPMPPRLIQAAAGKSGADMIRTIVAGLNADDWKRVAELLNDKAPALKQAGIGLGYHNHNFEFAPLGDTTGLEILLANTDPQAVTFEVDVGWAKAAGVDPLALIKKHKGRFTLMHVKDVKPTTQANHELRMDPTEIGSGAIDWKTLLPGAYAEGVRHFFVEQEPPFERPRIEAAKISHDFLARVTA